MRLEGKNVVVTGAGSGFGEGIARRFAEEGAKVLLADIDEAKGRAVADELATEFVRADVSRSEDVAAMMRAATEAFGGLDVIVNNAGVTHRNQPMLDVDEATFERVYAVNVKSVYHAAIHGVPLLKARGGGAILNIASTAGVSPRPGLTWYNGSKGAVITLTRSMAIELAPERIRVNAVNPVIGETGLTSEFMGGDTEELRAKFTSTIPLGRMSTPKDIAAAALYLCSDEAELVTGVCMEVDGGRCI